ncbi:TetR/AcrR family transcriptional regulator [Paenibacillus thiaminolyticus]|uniref:TetR/AcrR family transcriptional regulator n=1 Tax=Paenibacillus thiaminolyticus TaxID=49283 RepID=A0AAP9DTU4_PANTH|nr:TetR/AcrR family transcriptional regulator [Paenibacillus thiaminolyticus]MCY9537612.1 TetR/AcrR family transcriptional regulator [Paenibacillus thiaminolyticus]MCY9600725.1 TetR/AcrR family transcriptional regulator [Paenibacillus thiaminolyticus]MCY9607553.1 TetR/AcrR family transcriptional regulator [Paenibacillus thiaminolyticus]MCY9611353.1 TetR/AcrR family transcriptional regulator [Paenibacillus thiaminolyticus]MCY9617376.1 TetR/AcrR family transcriptional regulator [Paenibacillus th
MPGISKHQTDPRIRRTRQLIKDAFVALLQEMDIEKMSISSIAERATISRVTFYLHYRDIPDMLDKMADEMIEDLQHAMNSNPALPTSPEDKDWLRLVKMLEHIAENAPFYKVILGSRRPHIFTERLLQMFTELITARFENRETASSGSKAVIQKDIAIWYGSSALIGTIVGWLRNDMPYTPGFLAKQLYLLTTHDL